MQMEEPGAVYQLPPKAQGLQPGLKWRWCAIVAWVKKVVQVSEPKTVDKQKSSIKLYS